MNHPRNPPLLLRHLLPLQKERTLPPPGTRSRPHLPINRHIRINVRLVLNQHMAQIQHPIHILRGLHNRLILQHTRHQRMRNRPPRREQLSRKQRAIIGYREEGQHGLVRVDRSYEQSSEIGRGLLSVQIRTLFELFDLLGCEPEDLVDVFEAVRVAADGEVH